MHLLGSLLLPTSALSHSSQPGCLLKLEVSTEESPPRSLPEHRAACSSLDVSRGTSFIHAIIPKTGTVARNLPACSRQGGQAHRTCAPLELTVRGGSWGVEAPRSGGSDAAPATPGAALPKVGLEPVDAGGCGSSRFSPPPPFPCAVSAWMAVSS